MKKGIEGPFCFFEIDSTSITKLVSLEETRLRCKPTQCFSPFLLITYLHSHILMALYSFLHLDKPLYDYLAQSIAEFLIFIANKHPFLGFHVVGWWQSLHQPWILAWCKYSRLVVMDCLASIQFVWDLCSFRFDDF